MDWFNRTSSFEYSSIEIVNYSLTEAFIFCVFILAGIFLIRYLRSPKAVLIFITLIAANIYIYSSSVGKGISGKNKLNIFMLDVGQGDSFIITFPDGRYALIDAGSASPYFDNGERIIIPAMKKLGIEKFDYGFVSHIDIDHYGGFISLIAEKKIGKIFKPFPDTASDKDKRFELYLENQNIPVDYYSKKEA